MFKLFCILAMGVLLINCGPKTYKDDNITPEEFFSMTPEETFELDISPQRRQQLVNDAKEKLRLEANLKPGETFESRAQKTEQELLKSKLNLLNYKLERGKTETFEVVNFDTTHINDRHVYTDIIVKDNSGKVFEIEFDEDYQPKMGMISTYSQITVVELGHKKYVLVESVSKY